MTPAPHILLVGCGKMGSALARGWIAAGHPPDLLDIVSPSPPSVAGRHWSVLPSVGRYDALVVAVKPQKVSEALTGAARLCGTGTLVLSVAAGTAIARLAALTGGQAPVVRAMPNTPSAIGCGIAALTAADSTPQPMRARAELLMRAVGETLWVDTEDALDAVTAVSGSGPAYVFHLIEALAQAGVSAGLSADLAMRLARQTVIGSARLAEASDRSAADLRADVTSPGGTTAAGLAVLMPELPELMRRTVAAAQARAAQLRALA
ncbi:MAG: pyrroline-5-carboxylate reductase [Sphingomonadales bacterium]|nr:MAG: pyrroline-5-carboxylate reductase [Sphingomonadales bacterium]